MSATQGLTISHFGICVSDLERSRRFYTGALGFSFSHEVDFAAPFDQLTGLPGLDGHAAFYVREGLMIELLSYSTPEAVGPAAPRAMNQLGLTHIAVVVEDLDATAVRIGTLGGRALDETRVSTPMGDMMFATDPDGVRFELWEKRALA